MDDKSPQGTVGERVATVNDDVLALVERELRENPDLTSKELKERAVAVDQTVGQLSGRQFHAQYTIQVRKKLSRNERQIDSVAAQGTVVNLLESGYETRKAALAQAIDEAFQRAIKADSLAKVNQLFATLDGHRKDLEEV